MKNHRRRSTTRVAFLLLCALAAGQAASAAGPPGQSVEYHLQITTRAGTQAVKAFEGNVQISTVAGPDGSSWREVWDSTRDTVIAHPDVESPATAVVQRAGEKPVTVDLRQLATLSGLPVAQIVSGLSVVAGARRPWLERRPLRTENVTVWGRPVAVRVFEGSGGGSSWTLLHSDEIPITGVVRHRSLSRTDGGELEFEAEVRAWRSQGAVSRIAWNAGSNPTGGDR